MEDISPMSGMCPLCIEECNVVCEVGKAAFRGREVLYPSSEHFGHSTAASNKNFMLDWSHFQILSELLSAYGIEPDSDKAFFENADITTRVATNSKKPIELKLPIILAGLGSTEVAKRNWNSLAKGSAMSGIIEVIGENVCGMDPSSIYANGKVTSSPDMESRIASFRDLWDGKYGNIAVQTNVEDMRGGVDEYVISKLEVDIIERKWGQGAKAIGGEVRVKSLERAIELKKRGYLVLPDPLDPEVQASFKAGAFKTFERHSRVGFPSQRTFVEDVEKLRENGARYVFLKTGAYRPEVVAFTMKVASEAKIDLLTFDGAGGGTGMSPVPMMNEMSTPTVHLEAQVLMAADILKKQGRFVPDICFAGGFTNESQMYKAMAMSNLGDGPLVKAIGMARAPLTAAMKSQHFARLSQSGKLPRVFTQEYTADPHSFFVRAGEIEKKYPGRVLGEDIPWGAVGLNTFFEERIGEGLKQLLAGSRKFRLDLLDRYDIASLSEYSSKVTGIETFDQMAARTIPGMLESWDK
ncbi:MAG: FMN-binding glutamate synthase family protein [Euryarchaeota archaeon]|nr:FMN-binding glutamate synthase family protein [Euryarchaeota archaeon]